MGLEDDLLLAVEQGRLSVEAVLAACLARGAGAKAQAMARLLSRARREPAQRIRVRQVPALPAKVLLAAQAKMARRLRRRPGLHVGRGRVLAHGLATGEFGVVVHVPRKRRLALVPKRQRLPRHVDVTVAGRRHRVRVDVKEILVARKHGRARPGDRALVGTSDTHGTLSALISLPSQETVALISGHVARALQRRVQAQVHATQTIVDLGVVEKMRDDTTMDVALVRGVASNDVAALGMNPTTVLAPDHIVKGLSVTVLCTQADHVQDSYIEDVDAPAYFEDEKITMTGLLRLAACVTHHGDSGAAVMDKAGNLIGFVVGAAQSHTFAIPAQEAIDAMLDSW